MNTNNQSAKEPLAKGPNGSYALDVIEHMFDATEGDHDGHDDDAETTYLRLAANEVAFWAGYNSAHESDDLMSPASYSPLDPHAIHFGVGRRFHDGRGSHDWFLELAVRCGLAYLAPVLHAASPPRHGSLIAAATVGMPDPDGRYVGDLYPVRMRAGALFAAYLQFLPSAECTFVSGDWDDSAEAPVLAWEHPDHGVIVDYIDTVLSPPSVSSRDWGVEGLVTSANTQYGTRLAGVRYLPLGSPEQARWYAPDGSWTPLWGERPHSAFVNPSAPGGAA